MKKYNDTTYQSLVRTVYCCNRNSTSQFKHLMIQEDKRRIFQKTIEMCHLWYFLNQQNCKKFLFLQVETITIYFNVEPKLIKHFFHQGFMKHKIKLIFRMNLGHHSQRMCPEKCPLVKLPPTGLTNIISIALMFLGTTTSLMVQKSSSRDVVDLQ